MCLIIKRDQKSKIAQKDIVVFKIVTGEINSTIEETKHTFFECFPIEIGETYHSEIRVDKRNESIGIAIHSFKYLKDLLNYLNMDYEDRIFCGYKIHIARCIIPKGSEYYTGDFEDLGKSYASSSIEYLRIINK